MAIRINNDPEDAVGGAWGDVNLTSLRNRLADAVEEGEAGARSAVRECYGVVEGFAAPSQQWGYPHHVLRGDTLLIHVGGVQAATQRASQQGRLTGSLRSHLARHARALRQAEKIEGSILL